jgi:hypothetical protein
MIFFFFFFFLLISKKKKTFKNTNLCGNQDRYFSSLGSAFFAVFTVEVGGFLTKLAPLLLFVFLWWGKKETETNTKNNKSTK